MKWMLSVLVLAVLAGCGADGEPIRPTRDKEKDRVTRTESGAEKPGADWISGRVSVHAGATL